MPDYSNLRKIVTGDIVIKCRLGDDIRRIPINQAPTYDELYLMMCRVFKNEIKDPENILLKYTDDEGDLISLLNDIDIDHAISINNLVKITIFDKTLAQQTPQFHHSLVEIRDSLTKIIEAFDIDKEETIVEKAKEEVKEMKQARKLTSAELAAFDTAASPSSEEKSSAKELTALSPKLPANVPYYPSATQSQQTQYQPPTNNKNVEQHLQKPPVSQAQHQPQQLLPPPPQQTPQQLSLSNYPPTATPLQHNQQLFNPSIPNYPLPQTNSGPGNQLQHPQPQHPQPQHPQPQHPQPQHPQPQQTPIQTPIQTQNQTPSQQQYSVQQQPQGSIYYGNSRPPHPAGAMSTPQAPPQQFRPPPPTRW